MLNWRIRKVDSTVFISVPLAASDIACRHRVAPGTGRHMHYYKAISPDHEIHPRPGATLRPQNLLSQTRLFNYTQTLTTNSIKPNGEFHLHVVTVQGDLWAGKCHQAFRGVVATESQGSGVPLDATTGRLCRGPEIKCQRTGRHRHLHRGDDAYPDPHH